MSGSPSLSAEKRHWWLSNRKMIDKYVREARSLIATRDASDVSSALPLLDAALALSPRLEAALELKARSLLFLRRFREVADMLQDYIPSHKMAAEESSSSLGSSSTGGDPCFNANLLSPGRERSDGSRSFRCLSVADLKRRVIAGLSKNSDKEGPWRYLVLGQACCHLGLMDDAMVLLQTARRVASAAFRRESTSRSNDRFAFSVPPPSGVAPGGGANPPPPQTLPPSELESAAQLLAHIKLLLRRRAAATAALDAGLPAEAVRHFSKILDGRGSRSGCAAGLPSPFASACFIGRAAAHRAAGRPADAAADLNRALALDPASISALRARADLLESIRAIPDALRDLDHLKLLYDAILRDCKLPGPSWRPHGADVRYRDIAYAHRTLMARIQDLRRRMASGEACVVDYYALIGVRRGCTRSELERAHLLLSLKHKPEKASTFVDRIEIADEHRDVDAVRDQARMSALILYRMLQKGYASIMATVMEEAAEKQRSKEATTAAALAAAAAALQAAVPEKPEVERQEHVVAPEKLPPQPAAAAVFQGVFCRDLTVVGSMLSHRAIPVKYEALSC